MSVYLRMTFTCVHISKIDGSSLARKNAGQSQARDSGVSCRDHVGIPKLLRAN